ncbi:MAG: hypothetical protein HY602_01760, partial [Parcubacteria group bacterium]|nr:hypothetical protein [Parcubacteria group bacterium]
MFSRRSIFYKVCFLLDLVCVAGFLGVFFYFFSSVNWREEVKIVKAATTLFTTNTAIADGNLTYENDDITCDGAITLTVDGAHTFNSLSLINGCILTHSATTTTAINKLNLTITGTLSVCATCTIDVSGRGFVGGNNGGAGSNGRTSNGAGGQTDNPHPFGSGSH